MSMWRFSKFIPFSEPADTNSLGPTEVFFFPDEKDPHVRLPTRIGSHDSMSRLESGPNSSAGSSVSGTPHLPHKQYGAGIQGSPAGRDSPGESLSSSLRSEETEEEQEEEEEEFCIISDPGLGIAVSIVPVP